MSTSNFHWKERNLVLPEGQKPVTQRQFFFKSYFDFFKKVIGDRKNIVEIGCGRCTLGQYFARNGCSIECVDISKDAIDIAQKNFCEAGLKAKFIRADATNLPLGKYGRKYRDAIISVGLLEHLEGKDWQKALQEAHRILKPGGMLAFVNVPKKFSIQTFFQKHDHYHRESVTPEDYAQACRDAGFRVVNFMYVNPFPLMETKHEYFWTKVWETVFWLRGLVLEHPMQGSKRWAQAHLLLAIK